MYAHREVARDREEIIGAREVARDREEIIGASKKWEDKRRKNYTSLEKCEKDRCCRRRRKHHGLTMWWFYSHLATIQWH